MMTVKELINLLASADPNTRVYTRTYGGDLPLEADNIKIVPASEVSTWSSQHDKSDLSPVLIIDLAGFGT